MSLAVDGQDGNGLQLEKLRLNFSSCFRELKYLPLDVQRKCSEWIKLATTNFRIVCAKNPRDLRERDP